MRGRWVTCASASWGGPPRGRTVRQRLLRRRWLALGVLRTWCSYSIALGCYTLFSPLLNLCYFFRPLRRSWWDSDGRCSRGCSPTTSVPQTDARALALSAERVVWTCWEHLRSVGMRGRMGPTCASASWGGPPRGRTVRQRLLRRRWLALGVLRNWCRL